MAFRRLTAILITGSLGVFVCGCHSGEEHYTNWATKPAEYTPREDSSNAFDAYALAAAEIEQATANYKKRTFFYPYQREDIIKKTAQTVNSVTEATDNSCHFEFVPHQPFQVAKYQAGWRMIGRIYEWNVDDACLKGDFDKAIRNAVTGTIFGFDLSGGGATDVSLGLAIVDNVRKAIAPYLGKMSASQLDRLARKTKDALTRKPSVQDALKHEQENMLQTIQYVQDRVKEDKVKSLTEDMGPDVNEAVRFLNQIRGSESKRTDFFKALDQFGEDEFAEVEQNAVQPAIKWKHTKQDYPTQWRKLPKHIFGSARPLLDIDDATISRTRLLILYAEILKFDAQGKDYPNSLDVFSKDLTIDPYSGNAFVYHPASADFKLYSVGSNCRDDGGQTDSTFTSPDMLLECPQN